MTLIPKEDRKWLLIEWSRNNREITDLRSVTCLIGGLYVGSVVTKIKDYVKFTGVVLAGSQDLQYLERLGMNTSTKTPAVGPSQPSPEQQQEEEPRDYSPSGSSWAPSEDGSTDDSDRIDKKRAKLEKPKHQYSNTRHIRKILTPTNRVEAVVPRGMLKPLPPEKQILKRPLAKIFQKKYSQNSLPDSTKVQNTLPKAEDLKKEVTLTIGDLINLGASIRRICKLFQSGPEKAKKETPSPEPQDLTVKAENHQVYNQMEDDENKENEGCPGEEFNRSCDNVLITNKYDNVAANVTLVDEPERTEQQKKTDDREWVPIGSGKTLLHKDQFRAINWSCYTKATRSLLLALFPRKILATHSLTGKRSPAFQDKPAKMCLDPKIISDVVYEITDRFGVKENLVRSIITTKCADECKMYKTRLNKRKSMIAKKGENSPPPEAKVTNKTR